MSVTGKVVAVTGVSSGIGRAVASTFAERGALVVGCARRTEEGRALEDEVNAAGGSLRFVTADVTDPDDCRGFIDAARETHGRVDVLINNAGGHAQPSSFSPADELPPEEWSRVITLNLSSAFWCSQRAAHHMKRQDEGGLILTMSSIMAEQVIAGWAAYNTAKAGLVHLAESLAVELADYRIRSNAIIVGAVATPGSDKVIGEYREFAGVVDPPPADQTYFPRSMHAISKRALGEALVALAGDDARAINGATISIDRAATAGAVYSDAFLHAMAGRWTAPDDQRRAR